MIDRTHAADAACWVPGADDHADFPVQNLAVGVFSVGEGARRIGVAIGAYVLDLGAVWPAARGAETLNALFAEPPAARRAWRHAVFAMLTDPARQDEVAPHLLPAADCTLHLPFHIGDYSDFYVGIHHATQVGALFRPEAPLLPNYKHVPIGYHGRASSVRVSGTPVMRPRGQIRAADAATPIHAASARLDFELELGVWIAGDNALGEAVPIAQAWDRIGGLCLLNDWSARDMQAWEYQPLGPFLAKNFLTTVSPWVVTAEALAPFRTAPPARPAEDPAPLAYLLDEADRQAGALTVELEVQIATAAMRAAGAAPHRLGRSDSLAAMYWTLAQMVAHHASGGCDLHAGDLLGTGTLSGPTPDSCGSLIEMTRGGVAPITLPNGETRGFLEDGDAVMLTARAVRPGFRSIGFGPCLGVVEPPR